MAIFLISPALNSSLANRLLPVVLDMFFVMIYISP